MALSRGDEGERGAVYICLCNGLTDCRIQQAVAAGAGRPKEVYAACGCKAQCGGCTRTILGLIREGQAPAAGGASAGLP
jgi:bacterioferritin-associated ferredoxin